HRVKRRRPPGGGRAGEDTARRAPRPEPPCITGGGLLLVRRGPALPLFPLDRDVVHDVERVAVVEHHLRQPERRRRLGGGRLGRRTREEAEEEDEPGPGEGRAEGDAAAEGVAEEAVLGGALRRGVRRAAEAVEAGEERLVGGGGHREGLLPRDEAE